MTPNPPGNVPFGEIIFRMQQVESALILAGDEVRFTLNMPLPKNYIYQLQEADAEILFSDQADANEMIGTWSCNLSDQRGLFPFQLMVLPTARGSSDLLDRGFAFTFAGTAPGFRVPYVPTKLPSTLFGPGGTDGASADQPGLQAQIMNISTSATAAINISVFFRVLMFTIDQYNSWQINQAPQSRSIGGVGPGI